jgi:aryl-alcohol dehydrogenase-like predicted oxidoreductase
MPRLVVGTSHLGSVLPDAFAPRSDRERTFALLDALVGLGLVAFDLAASYQVGGTERLFGHWLSSRGNRESLFLISKGGHPLPVVQPHRLAPRSLAADLNASLKRLGTDHVDLYLVHRDDPSEPLDRLLATVTTFVQQGKIAAWGVSNWTHPRIDAIETLARAARAPSIAASSPHYSLLEWAQSPWPGCVSIAGESHSDARAYYRRAGIPVLAWSPLGSGAFSAGWDRHGRGFSRRTYASPRNEARRERARVLAQRYGCEAAQIALAYLFSQPFSVSAVVATRAASHMQRNLEALTLRLSADEIRWLDIGEGAPLAQEIARGSSY